MIFITNLRVCGWSFHKSTRDKSSSNTMRTFSLTKCCLYAVSSSFLFLLPFLPLFLPGPLPSSVFSHLPKLSDRRDPACPVGLDHCDLFILIPVSWPIQEAAIGELGSVILRFTLSFPLPIVWRTAETGWEFLALIFQETAEPESRHVLHDGRSLEGLWRHTWSHFHGDNLRSCYLTLRAKL